MVFRGKLPEAIHKMYKEVVVEQPDELTKPELINSQTHKYLQKGWEV